MIKTMKTTEDHENDVEASRSAVTSRNEAASKSMAPSISIFLISFHNDTLSDETGAEHSLFPNLVGMEKNRTRSTKVEAGTLYDVRFKCRKTCYLIVVQYRTYLSRNTQRQVVFVTIAPPIIGPLVAAKATMMKQMPV